MRSTTHATCRLCRRVSVTEWQILFDAINVGWPKDPGFFQPPAPFGIFGAQQVAAAGATVQHLAGAGDLETFGY